MSVVSESEGNKPVVVIAGASGFVGTCLRIALSDRYEWRALTRSVSIASEDHAGDNTQWRQCDLFSLPQVEAAMGQADVAIYLVHSMLPTTRLVQSNFQDMDVLLADNFARACESSGVRHIIYLGGIIPENTHPLSPHLASRLEVESVLASRGIPVTTLRSGIIFGPGGSSARLLINLVRKLPIIPLTQLARSRVQSIDIDDVVRAFAIVMEERSLQGRAHDIAGHEVRTYGDIVKQTAKTLGLNRQFFHVPIDGAWLGKFWFSAISGVSRNLVNPLLDSLKHDMVARPGPLLDRLRDGAVPLDASLRKSVDEHGVPRANPRARTQSRDAKMIRSDRRVRSIQRLPLPPGMDAPAIADEYGKWLTRGSLKVIRVTRDSDGGLQFYWCVPRILLLGLEETPFSQGQRRRVAYYICSGALARTVNPPGRLEFRIFESGNYCIAAIHGFAPRLPWFLYSVTQAFVHLAVMHAFRRHLQAISDQLKA